MADGKAGQRVFSGRDPASRSYGINYSTVRTGGGGTTVVKDPFRTNTGIASGGSGGGSDGGSGGGSGGSSSSSSSGSGGSGSFRSAAEDQYQANIDAALKAAKMNNPDIFGPFGQQTVEWKNGRPIITQTLSDDQQALLDIRERLGIGLGSTAEMLQQRADERMSTPFDMGGLPQISEGTMERDLVTQSMMERMQPFLDRQREQQQNQLMVQGHNRGGSAWNATQDDVARRENDARLAAVLAGGQEQNRLYELEAANRNRALQEQMFERGLPLQELKAVTGQIQGPNIPQYPAFQGQAINPAPLFDAQVASSNASLAQQQMTMQDRLARDQMALQQQIANQNLAAQQSANRMGGRFGIASAVAQPIADWAIDRWF